MNMEENVKKWLQEEDYLREIKFDENAEFHFICEFPKDNIMDVVKPKNSDCLVIACATQVSPEHLNLMKIASTQVNNDFIQELNFGLNRFLVDYELQISQSILQQFVITDQIFEDGLTKHELVRTLKRVFKSKLHCIWLINKYFTTTAPITSNENDMFV